MRRLGHWVQRRLGVALAVDRGGNLASLWSVVRALLLSIAFTASQGAYAATYSYRSDSFSWETAANIINTWDGSCTQYAGDDDKTTIALTGGFVFRFAGTDYNSVRVLSNGMLQFGSDTGFFRNFTNTTLPAGTATARAGCVASATARVIMAYWTDLDPSRAGSGKVSWEQKGSAPNRRLVVSWNAVYQYNTSTPYTFQIILFEGGEFKFQYGNANATGSAATIGVQVSTTDHTLYSFNSGYNANGTAIRWYVPSGAPARVAEYRFDEFSYSGLVGEVLDVSGNVHHGVRVGDTSSNASGQVCRAIDVPRNTNATRSGVDTLLSVPAGIGNKGTLSFWYRAGVAWNSSQDALLLDASGQADQPFFVQRVGGGTLRFRITDSAGVALTATSGAQGISANQWAHIGVTWTLATGTNQSTLRLYVNGNLVATGIGTTSGSLAPSLSTLFVGDNRLSAAPSGGTDDSANGRLDELRVYNYDLGPVEIAADMGQSHSCTPPVDHIEIRHVSGSGVTCTSTTFEVHACSDSACTVPYLSGVSGNLAVSPSANWVWPGGSSFSIPAGSSSTTVVGQLPVVGSATLSVSSASPSPTNAATCLFGGGGSCVFSAATAGFLLSVADHVSETNASLSLSAVRASDNALVCTPAFATVTKPLTLGCSYVTPNSGTLAVRVAGTALNAGNDPNASCGARSVNVTFGATGEATLNLQYADVGRVLISASYVGSADEGSLSMTGNTQVVAAPKDFKFSAIPAGPFIAGVGFGLTVTARNNAGQATPNFGREGESATLSRALISPTGIGAYAGTLSGSLSFTNGVASPNNLSWDEVGTLSLSATLTSGSYLGSGLTATGSSLGETNGQLGPFRPHRFGIAASAACGAPGFTYSGQPFGSVVVSALNFAGGITRNYNGTASTTPNWARALTFSDPAASPIGSFSAGWAASQFNEGVGTGSLSYTFTAQPAGPMTLGSASYPPLTLRATDSDGVSSSAGAPAEPQLSLRRGRIALASRMGSASGTLAIPIRLEYWSGKSWVLSGDDSCTTLSSGNVALSGRVNLQGQAAGWTNTVQAISLAGGVGSISLNPPSPSGSGTVDVALNLGGTATDSSCLPNHPASTGANRAWLRSQQGSGNACAGSPWTSDPSARASFGAMSPESQRRIHERQLY